MVSEYTKGTQDDHADTKKDVDLDKPPKTENTEQAPEVSTSTADDVLQKRPEDVAVVLLKEEGELCANTDEEAATEAAKPVTVAKPKRTKKDASKNVWVSNISRCTKASELKKLFSETFKVESAKIVTNGKSFFGYISLETAEMVQKSVKALNGFNLAGKIISVSITRPDLKAGRGSVGDQVRRGRDRQRQLNVNDEEKIKEDKQEDENASSKKNSQDSDDKTVEKKPHSQITETSPDRKLQLDETKADRRDVMIQNLKREVNTANSDLRMTKKRLRDSNSRLEFERSRKLELLSEVSKLESQIKTERRKISQEREQVEKKRKLEQIRFDDDKRTLNKELEECKKLREYLQSKVDEMRTRPRSRSPIRRSPVRRVGPSSSLDNNQRSRIMHMSPSKQRGYEAVQVRECIAPSAPKITKRSPPPRRSRERSPYKANKKTRMEYPSSYSSGPSGGNKAHVAHYQQTTSQGATPRSASWNSSYKGTYRYNSPTPGLSAYPSVGGELMHPSRFNSARPLEYPQYHQRVPGGPRKF